MSAAASYEASAHGPLKVLIAGAGIAGLTAALALRRQGHQVTIFERSALAQETGAALHLAPNCNGLLRKLGVCAERLGANLCVGLVDYAYDGELHNSLDMTRSNSLWQYDYLLSHRVHLHEALKEAAIGVDGKGTPAVLGTQSRVVDVDTSSATISLEDGQKFVGDLVVGADGVGSATRKFIPGGAEAKVFDSGKSAYRFLIPKKQLLEDPTAASAIQQDGYVTVWIGVDRRLVMYPCSDNTLLNFVAIHPSELSSATGEGWNERGSKDNLKDLYKDFEPRVRAILELVDPESLKVWTLLDMEKLPTWIEGRLGLIGDAAHPFLPHQGQGGGVAMEDAVSLALLLPLGTRPDEVPERLGLYERVRYERAHKIQHYTRLAGQDPLGDVKNVDMTEFMGYNLGHDEWHNSTHVIKKFLAAKEPRILRSPIGFLSMTSPRQLYPGNKISPAQSEFIRRTIRFRTSRTYLQTLFPSPSFSFASPGTVAEASFRVETLSNLGWLGGGGYSMFGLYIHGVRYTKKDGGIIHGTYLPVLFESLSDPITTGREEVGFPKVFCDIEVHDRVSRTHVVCSWRGVTFANIEWDGLSADAAHTNGTAPTKPAPADEGLFVYRYVPAVGEIGKADAEYPVFIGKQSQVASTVKRTSKARAARVVIEPRDWEALPTLHNITEALFEVPIYDVLEAKVEEGSGVDNLSHAQRIE